MPFLPTGPSFILATIATPILLALYGAFIVGEGAFDQWRRARQDAKERARAQR